MIDLEEKRLIVIWTILIGITLFSWESGWIHAMHIQAAIILILALVKVGIIILEFMEVRYAPRLLRFALQTWMVAIGAAMIGMIFYTS